MRLRLTVRRNGVPEVKLMWNVELDADFTISRLLASVNDVVPLESAEWGLEDYAMEYKDGEDSFECLHFQVVRDILKEDDQVLYVLPIHSSRCPGSVFWFERPWLTGGSRIRPLLTNDLRRRRLSGRHQITADGRHLVDGVAFGRPWLRAPVNRPGIELPPRKRARISYREGDGNIDGLDTDSSVHTSDYSYAASSVHLSEDEEQLLLEGPGDEDEGPGTVVGEGYVKDGASDQENPTPATEDSEDIGSLREESPPLPAYPGEAEPSPAAPPQTLSAILNRLKRTDAPSPVATAKDAARETGSGSSSTSDDTSSDDSSDTSSSDASDSTSSSDADSDSSSDSSSDSGEDARGSPPSAKRRRMGSRAPQSDSESTSAPSEEDVKERASGSAADSVSSVSSDSDDSSDLSDSSGSSVELNTKKQVQQPAPMPPPKGVAQPPKPVAAGATPPLTRTQKRNARKREAKRHQAEREAAAALAQGDAGAAPPAKPAPQDDEFTKRRQALLESLDTSASQTVTPRKRKADDESETNAAVRNDSAPPSAATQSCAASQGRMRFDLDAPRRLLFGALGFGGSKNKEQKPDAQINGDGEVSEKNDIEAPEKNGIEASEDTDAWRDKITYRAVECVREGVELSEPPFPFVQRWDPQQRAGVWFGNKRGGKGKRKQRDQAHYYEEVPGHGKKRKVSPWPDELDYDEGANGNGDAVENGDGGNEDADFHKAPEDLPALPKDINTLTPLSRGVATPGMVITWKQWLLSKATNWQPQFGSVTAVIASIDAADEDTLHVVLAKRDRNLDRNEKEYDEQTGQRIYGGFEAPDLDEEGEEGAEDEGRRIISFAEMMEPRIVHPSTARLRALYGNPGADLPEGDSAPIPESLPQDGQGDTNSEPFSMELQVPFSTDPVAPDGDSSAEQQVATYAADGKPQKNAALDVPSGVSSVASGRRQPDPNSLPVSLEMDMIPDSAPASPADKAKGERLRKSRSRSASRSPKKARGGNARDENPAEDKAPSAEVSDSAPDSGAAGIKPPGNAASFFEMGDEFLPKNLRRETNGVAVKKEMGRESGSEGLPGLEREGSLPRLIFPDNSPPRFGSQGGKRKKGRSSPFEVPAGSQVIDLLSDGEGSAFGTPAGSQRQSGTPRSQSRNGTPASQRGGRGTPGSQKGQRDSLPRGAGWVKKRKGFKAEAAV